MSRLVRSVRAGARVGLVIFCFASAWVLGSEACQTTSADFSSWAHLAGAAALVGAGIRFAFEAELPAIRHGLCAIFGIDE